jgi:hypothetical protein
VGRIDQMGDALRAQIGCQPLHPAKAAHPRRDRLRARVFRAPGIAERRAKPVRGQEAGQFARLAGAPSTRMRRERRCGMADPAKRAGKTPRG